MKYVYFTYSLTKVHFRLGDGQTDETDQTNDLYINCATKIKKFSKCCWSNR